MNMHARTGPRATVPADSTPVPAIPLTEDTLRQHAGRVRVPTYDRSALVPSVVHFSVGGFHRAHQLVYFDDLAELGNTDWGVVGVGLRSPAMRDALRPQDHLYTLVERGSDGERARVIGSMIAYHFAPEDPEAVLARLTDERTRLVTMTVTGTAYRLDPVTGEFDPDDDDVRADLADPQHPRSLFGYIVEGLDRRRRAGLRPFTVLSCDNMQQNGEAARAAVVGFARLRDEVLAAWIADHVAFPGSMVDRITPSTSLADRAAVAARFGIDDRWPVITETFSQWVMEDSFSAGRPPLEDVYVQFVPDVVPHELIKTRLLNASHSAIGHLGTLAGHSSVHEVMADPLFYRFVTRLMGEEIAPLLPCPEGIDLADYQHSLLRRFADPALGDRLDRLCRRSSSKVASYLLPSLRTALDEGRPADLLTLAFAGWCRYVRGTDLQGRPILVEDDRAAELAALAAAGGTNPRPLLGLRSVVGDLGDDPAFVEALTDTLRRLDRDGVRATLTHLLDRPDPVGDDAVTPGTPAPRRRGAAASPGGHGDRHRDRRGRRLPAARMTPVPPTPLRRVHPMPDIPAALVERLQTLLCDADGNLFPSEEPAFVASAEVTNRYLAALGTDQRFTAEELRLATTGKNFRTTAADLAAAHGVTARDLDDWVAEEKHAVTAHLGRVLRPDTEVTAALTALGAHLTLAVVSSSALTRLAACFTATGLDDLLPADRRYSAEDSLPTPTSKPDPAVYLYACEQLGIAPEQGLAVEDSVPGALSAVRAGCPTIGNLRFVPAAERVVREAELREAGVLAVVSSWTELADLLLPQLTTGPVRVGARR
jgi:mannitol 2-dehydrogenase